MPKKKADVRVTGDVALSFFHSFGLADYNLRGFLLIPTMSAREGQVSFYSPIPVSLWGWVGVGVYGDVEDQLPQSFRSQDVQLFRGCNGM